MKTFNSICLSLVAISLLLSTANQACAEGNNDSAGGRAGSWRKATQGSPSLKGAKAAVAKNPQDAAANNDLGWAYRQNGDTKLAMQYLREAIKLKDDMPQAHSNLSVVLSDTKDFGEAITEAKRAVQLDDKNAIYHVVLGNALDANKQGKEAIAEYRKAVELKPDYENTLYHLGKALLDDGQTSEAQLQLVEALKYDPRDDRVLVLLDKMTGTNIPGADKRSSASR